MEAARLEYCTYGPILKQTAVNAWSLWGGEVLLLRPLTQSEDTVEHTFEALGAGLDWTGPFLNPQDTC